MASTYGLVALAGIVVNNSIVLVEFINRLRAAGVDKWRAIINAGRTRLRPILLTSITTVCGLLPMGAGNRREVGDMDVDGKYHRLGVVSGNPPYTVRNSGVLCNQR